MKQRIIVPCSNHDIVNPAVMSFLTELNSQQPDIKVMLSKNALPSRGRNEGVFGRYIDLKHPNDLLTDDVYAFLDSDVLPELEEYLATINRVEAGDFISGIYQMRGSEQYAVGTVNGPLIMAANLDAIQSMRRVDWVGGGLLFIGREVLSRLAYPYFHESVAQWSDEDGVERATIFGEDVTFSMKAIKAGFRIQINERLIARHLTKGD